MIQYDYAGNFKPKNHLEQYQIDFIKRAFSACYGLRDGIRSNDTMQSLFIVALSTHTGLRSEYLKLHLTEIQTL